MFLALNPKIEYVLVESEGGKFILAEARLSAVFKDREYKVLQKIKAKELEGSHYEPLFPYFKNWENCYRVVLADFVTVEDGTGVVHIAPAFGEDDLALGTREKNHSYLPCKIGRNIYSGSNGFRRKIFKRTGCKYQRLFAKQRQTFSF